ncbi:pheromone-binding protein Gp-9-like [Andrena cerasifolii]|uniref:pheromone-binding protein Gp-9-like n=1 Tax=Andrena cerasifolii TaxID=2819439 RepID=UPI00403794E7
MKSLLVVGCLCLVAATVRADKAEMDKFMELAKEHVESCGKEVGVSEAEWVKFHDENVEGDDKKKFGCMQACIMKQMGMMDGAAFNPDKMKEVLDKILPDREAADAQLKMATDCIEQVKDKDEACEAAMAFSQCYAMKSKPE